MDFRDLRMRESRSPGFKCLGLRVWDLEFMVVEFTGVRLRMCFLQSLYPSGKGCGFRV